MSKPIIGLALGSGAARGFSHIGILEVLEEEGIRPDVIAGCSIGAFVGAAYLAGRLNELRDWAEALTWREVARLLDVSLKGGGLFGGEPIERLMDNIGIRGNIEDFDKPFATVATDYVTGREEWLREGPVGKAIRASMSIPGVLTPVELGGNWYVDGGLVNPVPVSICRALGAEFIIAVNLNGDLVGRRKPPARSDTTNSGRQEMVEQAVQVLPAGWRQGTARAVQEFLTPEPAKPGYFDVLANSINIMQDRITRSRLAGEPPHVMIAPRLAAMGPFDFDQAKLAIEEGRERARFALPEIRRAVSAEE
jgi:NTE family protein